MITKKLIPEEIESFEYYKNKIPLYLKNSYGFMEHFKIWHEILIGDTERAGVVGNGEIFLNLLLIFDPNYFTYLSENLEDFDPEGNICDILDKIGELFGVSRNFTINYVSQGTPHTEDLQLNNKDFLILIKARIIKNYCDGTLEIMNDFYKDAKIPMEVRTSDSPATANIWLIKSGSSEYHYSENVEKMYLAGMLTIESVGISYVTDDPIDLLDILIWFDENMTPQTGVKYNWDEGEWIK